MLWAERFSEAKKKHELSWSHRCKEAGGRLLVFMSGVSVVMGATRLPFGRHNRRGSIDCAFHPGCIFKSEIQPVEARQL